MLDSVLVEHARGVDVESARSPPTSVQRSRSPSVSKRDPTRSERLSATTSLAAVEQLLDERAADQALRARDEAWLS